MTADRRDPTNPFAPTEYPGWMDDTPDNLRAALVEKVARALCANAYKHIPGLDIDEQATDPHWAEQATAAIALIRAEVLEEAARVADENAHEDCEVAEQIAAAIRALKEKP